jgi:osmotically-inducible protein OsmY
MNHVHEANSPKSRSYSGVLKKIFGGRQKSAPPSKFPSAKLTKPARSDTQVEQDVKDELRSEHSIRASAIDVQVKDGVVTMTGPIDGEGEQWLIEAAAHRIVGVKGVSMKLNVVVPEPGVRTDDDIASECEDVLATLIPGVDYVIHVMVSNGWVTLSGDVTWGYERWIAETRISDLSGVLGINSQIKVRPTVLQDDVDAIIAAAMRGHKDGEPHAVESTVDRDRVTLTGTVHSWAERRAALNAARSSTGVKRVIDRMLLT